MTLRFNLLQSLLAAASIATLAGAGQPALAQNGKAVAPAPAAPAAPPPAVKKASALWQTAITFQRAKRYTEAVAAYGEFLRYIKQAGLPPITGKAAYQNMAAIFRPQGNVTELISALKSWSALAPDEPAPHSELSTLYASPARRDFAEAEKEARKTLALKPNGQLAAAAHSSLGLAAIYNKRYPAAEQEFAASVKLIPNSPQMVYNLGLALVEEKKFAPALVQMQKAASLNPKMPGAWYYVGVLDETQHKLPEAIKALRVAAELAPGDPTIRLEMARAQGLSNDIDGALTTYLATVPLAPQNIQLRITIAQLYLQLQNPAAARAQLADAIKLAPKNAQALALLAGCEAQLSYQPQDAASRARFLKQAEDHYRSAAAIEPAYLVGQNSLARFYERTGSFAKAQEIYRKRIAADPNDASNYSALANTYIMERKPDEAIAVWKQYRALKPGDPTSYMQVAETLEGQSKWNDAVAEWRLLLAQKLPSGTVAGARFAIGRDLARAGSPKEATAELESVLKMDQTAADDPEKTRVANAATVRAERLEAMRQLAEIADKANDLDAAIRWQQQIKAEEAATAERTNGVPNAATYIALAHLYQRAKKPELAIKELDALTQTRQLHKDAFAPAYEELALVYESQKRTEEAAAAYRRAAIYSRDPLSDRLHAADVYQRAGKLPMAITEFEELRKDLPKEGRVLSPLAMAYRQAGRDEDALKVYDSLLALDPRANWARDQKAAVYSHMKRYDDARALYEDQIAAYPENRQLYADVAFVFQSQGKADAFLDWLKPRFEKSPGNATIMAALVDESIRQKKEDAAWALLRDSAERHKTNRGLVEAAAGVMVQHNRLDDALALDRIVAAQYPKDLSAQTSLADALFAAGHKEEATRLYGTLIARTDLKPGEKLSLRRLYAQGLVDQKALPEAIAQLQEIVHEDPNDADSASRLAQELEAAGRAQEAIPVLQGLATREVYPAVVRAQIDDKIGGLFLKAGDKSNAELAYRSALKLNPKDPAALAGLAGLK